MTDTNEREAFEKLYAENFLNHVSEFFHKSYFELVDGEYVSLHCQGAYDGYKLALAHKQNTAEPIYQEFNPIFDAYYDCDKKTYDIATKKRIVYLEPPQPQSVKDALEKAANICEEMLLYTGWDMAKEIRALIKESEGE